MEVKFAQTTEEHLVELSQTMREADVVEVYASLGIPPLDGLRMSVEQSTEVWTALIDGEVACVFGIAVPSVITSTAIPFLRAHAFHLDSLTKMLGLGLVVIENIAII